VVSDFVDEVKGLGPLELGLGDKAKVAEPAK
jgi:hypothetical protein